jgi:hypothetical protein
VGRIRDRPFSEIPLDPDLIQPAWRRGPQHTKRRDLPPSQLPTDPDAITPSARRRAQFAVVAEAFDPPSDLEPPREPFIPAAARALPPPRVSASARKRRIATGRANPPSLHSTNLASQPPRRRAPRVSTPTLPDEPIPVPTMAETRWGTTRGGDTRNELEGWGLDPPHSSDLVALRMELKRLKTQPQWLVGHISPVSPSYLSQSTSYYTQRPNSPARARRHQATENHKRTFLAALENGLTVEHAARLTSVSPHTIGAWRRRDLSFDARYQQIMSGERNVPTGAAAHYDGTFAGTRKFYFGYDSYAHHLAIIDAIDKTPEGGVTMVLCPPEAGKTSVLEDYLCHRLAHDPNYRILYVTETAGTGGHAQKVLSTVKERMTDPDYSDPNAPQTRIPEWIARFGPFHDPVEDTDKPWNQNYIKLSKTSGRRDYSLQCAGWRSRIYGARCDLLVFDDVQSDVSLGQTEQMLRTIRRTFLSRPGKKGKTIFIGTRIGKGDVYERLIEEGVVDELVQIPALDTDGNSYCPEMWPPDDLAKKRVKVGEDAWWSAYMQQPQMAEDATFTDELLDEAKDIDTFACRRPDLVIGGDAGAGSWKIIAGLDPALGGGNALHVAAVNHSAFRVVDQFINYRLMRNEDIFSRIKEATRYHFTELIVERNSQQRGLARDDRLREIADRFGFRIVEHETGNNKWDFNYGIAAMAGSFVRHEVIIPWGDDLSRARMQPLIDELRGWRPNLTPKLQRQDMVMSMWFCWLWWQKQRHIERTDEDQWQAEGTPWEPGDMSGRWSQKRLTVVA